MQQFEGLGGFFLIVGIISTILISAALLASMLITLRRMWINERLKAQTELLDTVSKQIRDLYGVRGFLTSTSVALMLSNIRRGVAPDLQLYQKHDLTMAIQVTEYDEEDIRLILDALDKSEQWIAVDGDSGFNEKLPTAERAAASVIRNLLLKVKQKEMS